MKKNILWENQYKYAMQAALMKLYSTYGYTQIAIPACENLSALAEIEKNYPINTKVKFMDQSGEIFILQNDPTASIMKMLLLSKTESKTQKICYYSPTYKWGHRQLTEETQIGIEAFGEEQLALDIESIVLAIKSLKHFTKDATLDIGDVNLLKLLLIRIGLDEEQIKSTYSALCSKNPVPLKAQSAFKKLSPKQWQSLEAVFDLYGPSTEVIAKLIQLMSTLKEIDTTEGNDTCHDQIAFKIKALEDRNRLIQSYDFSEYVKMDLTLKPDLEYYSGLVLKGYIKNCPTEVLTGGRYDNLSLDFGQSKEAVGFALNLDLIIQHTEGKPMIKKNSLLLLETTLSSKGIEYAEYYRELGFEVNLTTFTKEKEAIDMATKEKYERVIFFEESAAKIIDIQKNNVTKLPYTAFEQYLTLDNLAKSIH